MSEVKSRVIQISCWRPELRCKGACRYEPRAPRFGWTPPVALLRPKATSDRRYCFRPTRKPRAYSRLCNPRSRQAGRCFDVTASRIGVRSDASFLPDGQTELRRGDRLAVFAARARGRGPR